MDKLSLYAALSRIRALNYRAKIMIVAFLGTHVPLLAIIAFYVLSTTTDMGTVWATLGVALVATLVGTGITLYVFNQLLQPVLLTSRTLRRYRESREVLPLPTEFTDEAGTLMADAQRTLTQLEASLVTLETTDPVTGLPNREAFLAAITAETAEHDAFAVAAIHFPGLQRIGATYDKATADGLARTLAARLAGALGRTAGLARVDDTTFAALPQISDRDPVSIANQLTALLRSIDADVDIEGVSFTPELSLGVALFPDDSIDAEALLADAIAASTRTGQQHVAFHSAAARDAARAGFELEQDIRRAIRNDEFVLAYQPVVDLAIGRVTGAEALIRWQHPEHGLVAPGRFIPTAERTGLIDDIGEFVVRQACRQVADWQAEGIDDLKVAVNVSARQFRDPRLLGLVRETLADTRVDPRRLEIELTESAAMADHDYTKRAFDGLHDLGVTVAIDDFGTGYTSMSYLRKLPFDKLKIDREFVSHIDTSPENQAICDAVLALSRGLGLRVLAEGAERPEEVEHLLRAGCTLFQGFVFALPVMAHDMAETLADLRLTLAAAAAPDLLARSA